MGCYRPQTQRPNHAERDLLQTLEPANDTEVALDVKHIGDRQRLEFVKDEVSHELDRSQTEDGAIVSKEMLVLGLVELVRRARGGGSPHRAVRYRRLG